MSSVAVTRGLRKWAKGAFDQEAGVELLIRGCGGRFARQGCPWIRTCERPGWFWMDVSSLLEHAGAFSGGEQRVLMIAAALIDRRPIPDLAGVLCGLDRADLQLVLAALAHAAGSHEQVELVRHGEELSVQRLSALVPWPVVQGHAA